MKSTKNQIKSALIVCTLCFSALFFNSCQTSEDEIVFSSTELFTKDSKIVPLFLKALGANGNSKTSFTKSFVDDQQCTQFVYPMTFYAYGSDAEEPSAVVINNDEEFIAFLTSLTSGQEFFITYPVTLLDVDGNETVINDYPDLEGILTMLVNACQGDDGSGDDGSGDDGSSDDGSSDDGSGDDGSGDDGSGDDGSGDDGSGDDGSGDDGSGDDGSGDDGSGDDETEYEYCGNNNKKVVICHNGNTICISINAIWGHMAHHEDDYFGNCNN